MEQRQRCSYFLSGGIKLATTRIMPLHVGRGRTESRAIADIPDYAANPEKRWRAADIQLQVRQSRSRRRISPGQAPIYRRHRAQPWPGRCAGLSGAAVLQARRDHPGGGQSPGRWSLPGALARGTMPLSSEPISTKPTSTIISFGAL